MSATDIWISLIVFVLIYAVLGVADAYLMIRYGRQELGRRHRLATATAAPTAVRRRPVRTSTDPQTSDEDRVPALIY